MVRPDERTILEVRGSHDDRGDSRHPLRDPAAPGDGGRSGAPVPGVGGGPRKPQGRTARGQGGQDSFRQHGFRRLLVPAGCGEHIQSEQHLPREDQRTGKEAAAPHRDQPRRRHHRDRRGNIVQRARHQPGVSGRRIHHRTPAGIAELRWRRAGMGLAGSASHLHVGTLSASGAAGGTAAFLGPGGGGDLLLDRAPHCRRRNAGGCVVYAVQDAQAIGHRDGAGLVFVAMIVLYHYFISGAGNLSSSRILSGSLVAAGIMIVVGFFFAAVSGNLVGMIGSSNNPVSGLTLCTLVIAALLMVALGVSGGGGVAAVLGVAAIVCVSSAVAGEMLQDLKVGHILGGTPAKMQIGDIFGVIVASLVLFWPLSKLDFVYHFGTAELPAPQAGLMAMLSKGIVGGDMAWPLVVVGVMLGIAMIMIEVKSVMLFSVGMYLPLGTTFAIFVGGVIRWITDSIRNKRDLNEAQKARVDNAGILTASGLIAGEALCGIAVAAVIARRLAKDPHASTVLYDFGLGQYGIMSVLALALLVAVMILVPLANAGRPEDPAPPTAIM